MTGCCFATGNEKAGKLAGLRRILRGLHGSGQHHIVVDEFDANIGTRDKALQLGRKPAHVPLDLDIDRCDLLAILSEDEDIGLSDLLAEKIDAPRRARHSIGYRRIGDENVIGVLREIEDNRFVEAELDCLRTLLAANLDDACRRHCIHVGQRQGNGCKRAGQQRAPCGIWAHAVCLSHERGPISVTLPDLMTLTVPLRVGEETR